ncbi:MAG: hypothetical protein CVV54_08590 [Synergistetes bacterium HGW-Synergistetes-1]|nr:MAG: hypothetical protein CVV54_08590 [Synergistetes bacterium HGW-Synergistetes-1]
MLRRYHLRSAPITAIGASRGADLAKRNAPSLQRMLRQWRSAALRCRAKWRFHRREAVGKQLFNAAGKISGGEQLASIGKQLYKLNLGSLSVVQDDPYRESTIFRQENFLN